MVWKLFRKQAPSNLIDPDIWEMVLKCEYLRKAFKLWMVLVRYQQSLPSQTRNVSSYSGRILYVWRCHSSISYTCDFQCRKNLNYWTDSTSYFSLFFRHIADILHSKFCSLFLVASDANRWHFLGKFLLLRYSQLCCPPWLHIKQWKPFQLR